jgi:hypothetical protein
MPPMEMFKLLPQLIDQDQNLHTLMLQPATVMFILTLKKLELYQDKQLPTHSSLPALDQKLSLIQQIELQEEEI